jgi:hypothetical protein
MWFESYALEIMACGFGHLDCVTIWIKMPLWIRLMTRGAFTNNDIVSVMEVNIGNSLMMNGVYSYEFSSMNL